MKKILLFTVILGGSLAFTSCSSDTEHTCKCTISNGTVTYSETAVYAGVDEDAASTSCMTMVENASAGETWTCGLVD